MKKIYKIYILVCINKVLLAHSHAHLCPYCLQLLSRCRNQMAAWPAKPKVFTILPFTEKVY